MRLNRKKLLRARELLGYGIEKVAEEAGVSKNSVLRAEHADDIRPVTARKIAAALRMSVADLIGESDLEKAEVPPSQGTLFNGPTATELPGLQTVRERCGIERKELAARSGISLSDITVLEAGGEVHDPFRVRPVADILGCSPAELMFSRDQYEAFRAEADQDVSPLVEEELSKLSPETRLALRRAHERLVKAYRKNDEQRARERPKAG